MALARRQDTSIAAAASAPLAYRVRGALSLPPAATTAAGLALALAIQGLRVPAERTAQAILDLGPEDTR